MGVYKPLVITPDGEILGGNQRYKALCELVEKEKRHEWVWVSIVEAWTDEERLKYALSDNYSAGEYTRDKLREIIKIDQSSLFSNYDIEFTEKKTIDDFITELAITEEELKFKGIKKDLKNLGINEETIDVLETMAMFNKHSEELDDVDLKGKIVGQKFPFLFWFEDETLYEQFKEIYNTGYKDKYDTNKLVEYTGKLLGLEFPTDMDTLKKLLEDGVKLKENIQEHKELDGSEKTIEQLEREKSEKTFKIKSIYRQLFPEEFESPEGML